MKLRASAAIAVATLGAACGGPREHPGATTSAASAPSPSPPPPPPAPPPPPRPQLDGRAFPDKVLALTWDDGPDARTLDLARFLRRHRVSGTFFVVARWTPGVSSDPGEGEGVFATGYESLPVLGDLVALGHRLGNHTEHHVLLGDADAATVAGELGRAQAGLDRWITNECRLFRAPGGSWNAAASAALDADPAGRRLIGPIRWDVDGKDWEGSLYCREDDHAKACEPAAPGRASRVKPQVIARRYLDRIEAAGHGIVLFHDRVGHVGSRYALDVAEIVVPALIARGYVFAAPVLQFSELGPRRALATAPPRPPATLDTGGALRREELLAAQLADVDGDGKPDLCIDGPDGVRCALARGGGFTKLALWSQEGELAGVEARFGDLNGDGRADVCARTADGVVCALSTGKAFTRATVWLPRDALVNRWLPDAALRLADVNGDGRADACGLGNEGLFCGLAP
jgi:peptidoglycan/xylan/chitin deacetylase (PgdA/CDA1 family)